MNSTFYKPLLIFVDERNLLVLGGIVVGLFGVWTRVVCGVMHLGCVGSLPPLISSALDTCLNTVTNLVYFCVSIV